MMEQRCGDCIFYGANGADSNVCGYFNVNPLPDCVPLAFPEDGLVLKMDEFSGCFCPCFERVEQSPKGE
jgi:hypothetical protein